MPNLVGQKPKDMPPNVVHFCLSFQKLSGQVLFVIGFLILVQCGQLQRSSLFMPSILKGKGFGAMDFGEELFPCVA